MRENGVKCVRDLSVMHKYSHLFPLIKPFVTHKIIQRTLKGGIFLDRLALVLLIIGGLNWGLVGIFGFDAVAWMLGGQTSAFSRIVYILVALAAVWSISFLFRRRAVAEQM